MHRRGGRPRVPVPVLMAVAGGGAVGAVARYGIGRVLPGAHGQFPWSTFLVNITGSALLGVLLTVVVERAPRGRLARPLLGTGVIGAYTTFSTFTADAVLLVRAGRPGTAAAYVIVSLVAGLAAATLGVVTTRSVFTGDGLTGGGLTGDGLTGGLARGGARTEESP